MPILDKYEVSRALVFPNPNVGDKYPETNDYITQCLKKHPKRLVGFGRVDPRRDTDVIDELRRIKHKLHLSGIKLHPVVECFRPDHPFFDRFFREVEKLGLPVLIHTEKAFRHPV